MIFKLETWPATIDNSKGPTLSLGVYIPPDKLLYPPDMALYSIDIGSIEPSELDLNGGRFKRFTLQTENYYKCSTRVNMESILSIVTYIDSQFSGSWGLEIECKHIHNIVQTWYFASSKEATLFKLRYS
jgi:hypothetical protein